jgi:hypothetical protein
MTLREVLSIGATLATQAGCTCGAPETAVGVGDAGHDAQPVMTVCDNMELETGCVASQCKVTATGNPLPRGASLTVTAKSIPATLDGDTIAPVLCSIAVSHGVKSVPNLTLSMKAGVALAPSAVLFQYVSPVLSELVGTSGPLANEVVGLVTAPGEFGATEIPAPWSLAGTLGVDLSESGTQADLLRNLSSEPFGGSFYDGTHLFVSNGPRVLIYAGIPATPDVQPAVVLGQPGLDAIESETSSSLFGSTAATAIWSDGTHLVVGHSNRVLIWNTIPKVSQTPADIVLGQPDFNSNSPNNPGISATTFNDVAGVDSDGTQLVIADLLNNRALLWTTFPTTVDQAADFEVGQTDFMSNGNGAGAVPIYQTWGVALDTSGLFLSGQFDPGVVHVPSVSANNAAGDFIALGLSYTLQPTNVVHTAGQIARTPGGGFAVRDTYLSRIVGLNSIPTGPVSALNFVLGQPDLTRVVESLTSASLVTSTQAPSASGLGTGQVFSVPDGERLLIFDTPPSYNFEPATRVLGQPGFTTNGQVDYRGVSASTLAVPADVAVANGTIAVADRGNNRVLLYPASRIIGNGPAASVVLGQTNATSYVPNVNQETPSASTLSGPSGVALDGTHLIVADTENHRVLIWNTVPTTTGTAADIVLGQTDFSGRRPNSGRGDASGDGFSDAAADGFFFPMGVASNGTNLFVVDRMNNRVLVWNTFPTTNGQSADAVIGQPDLTTVLANAGAGAFTFSANGLNLPTGIALVGTSLWVADTENNRLVRWDTVTNSPTPGAVVGQPSFTTVANPNYELLTDVNVGFPSTPSTTTASVLRPRGVVSTGSVLYVTEMDSNRVHMFDATSLMPLGELGQSSDSAGTPNTNGVTAASVSLPLGATTDGANLWVADSNNNRVLAFPVLTTPATGAPATLCIGQVTLLTNGFNQSSTAANGATSAPHGLTFQGTDLYVADTGHSRVLVMQTPFAPGDEPVKVYGQPNATLALQNSGGPPSASTLNEPRGVFADKTHVVVSDTANNRVLIYTAGSSSTAATLVLGQASFTTNAPNSGGPSASSMQGPAGAYTDGSMLWVTDTGNHRVLGWKTFPTKNGQPADIVLGQSSFAGILGNRGTSQASAISMSFPSDVRVVNGVLYVADSGNNRVLSFSTLPSTSGAAADGVLGQPNLTSRIAAVLPTDLTHMAGPVALASDKENLYVSDRDLGRGLVFHIGTITAGATQALSSAAGLVLSGPAGIASQETGLFTSMVYLSNTGMNQIEELKAVSRLVQAN